MPPLRRLNTLDAIKRDEVQMSDTTQADRRIVRQAEAVERTGLSRTTLWTRIRAGSFPAPVDLGGGKIGFFSDELDRWLSERKRVPYAPAVAA